MHHNTTPTPPAAAIVMTGWLQQDGTAAAKVLRYAPVSGAQEMEVLGHLLAQIAWGYVLATDSDDWAGMVDIVAAGVVGRARDLIYTMPERCCVIDPHTGEPTDDN